MVVTRSVRVMLGPFAAGRLIDPFPGIWTVFEFERLDGPNLNHDPKHPEIGAFVFAFRT